MSDARSFTKRLILAAGLAAAVLSTTALGVPTAGADPSPPRLVLPATVAAPTLGPLQVQAFGTRATVTLTSSEPTALAAESRPAGTTPPPSQGPRGPLGGTANPFGTAGTATAGDPPPPAAYQTQHQFELTPLQANTAYDVSVVATTRSGQQLTAQTRFTTLKQRVRITLREIDITEDGDGWWMNGEPMWFVHLSWPGGKLRGCYPNTDVGFGGVCQHDDRGEGRFFPRNNKGQVLSWTFAEENFDAMPDVFAIYAEAQEADWIPGLATLVELFEDCFPGCDFTPPSAQPPWQVPQGLEWASTPVRVHATAPGFTSVLTFTFELFHDNLSYPSNHNRPSSTWRSPFGR